MKSRTAIIGSGAFPPLLRLFLETTKVWSDEVDSIYIAVDKFNIPGTEEYVRNLCKKYPKVILLENTRIWPQSYNDALNVCKEDMVLLMHDDTLIYEKGIVDKYFKIAEQGKIVVPLHEIYSPKDIVEKALEDKYPGKFPLTLKEKKGIQFGWKGYSFLLYFLFAPKQVLLDAGAVFGTDRISKEQAKDLLGIDNSEIGGDTGFVLGLNLFKNGVEIVPIPRYETVYLTTFEDPLKELKKWRDNKEQIFEGGWFHLQNTGNTIPLWFSKGLEGSWITQHHEVRLAWFSLMLSLDKYPLLFRLQAGDILNRAMELCNADYNRIQEMSDIFRKLLKI